EDARLGGPVAVPKKDVAIAARSDVARRGESHCEQLFFVTASQDAFELETCVVDCPAWPFSGYQLQEFFGHHLQRMRRRNFYGVLQPKAIRYLGAGVEINRYNPVALRISASQIDSRGDLLTLVKRSAGPG